MTFTFPTEVDVEKLYKRIRNKLHYHEAWIDKSKIMEHWGVVGEKGETREHTLAKNALKEAALTEIILPAIKKGYAPITEEFVLMVEYVVEGFGTSKDLKKRHALEELLNEITGWHGLGECDGGSIGSGTMEACCFVVDFKIAKRVIERELAGTEFADYTRIYLEE